MAMQTALQDIRHERQLIEAFIDQDDPKVRALRDATAFGPCLEMMSDGLSHATLFADETTEAQLIEAALKTDRSGFKPTDGLPGFGPIFLWGLPALRPCQIGLWLASAGYIHQAGLLPFLPMALEESLMERGLSLWSPEGIGTSLDLYPRRMAEAYLLASSNHRGEKRAFIDSLPQSLLIAPVLKRVFPDARALLLRGDADMEVAALKAQGIAPDEAVRRQARYDRLANHMLTVMGDAVMRVDYQTVLDAPEGMLCDMAMHLKVADSCLPHVAFPQVASAQ